MNIHDIPLRAFNKKIYSYAFLKLGVQDIISNQINYLKSYLVELPDKEIFFTHPILKNDNDFNTIILGKLADKSQEGLKNSKFSFDVFSTCFALISLQKLKNRYQEIEELIGARNIFDNYRMFLLTDEKAWRFSNSGLYFDIFSTPFKLLYIKQLQTQDRRRFAADINHYLIVKGLSTIIRNLSENEAARFSTKHDYSAFLSYWCVEALIAWWDKLEEIDPKRIDKNKDKLAINEGNNAFLIDRKHYPDKDKVALILNKIYNWSEFQLYRQLAIYHIGNNNLTDPVNCAYSLLIYNKIHSFTSKNKDMRRYAMKGVVKQLVESVISILLKSNLSRLLWNKQTPVITISDNTEDVYPFVLTSISELLRIADPTDSIYDEYMNNFTSALKWIKDNEVVRHHIEKSGDNTGNDNKNEEKVGSFSGWRSPTSLSQHGNPECWSTALVFDSLHTMDTIAEDNLNKEILRELRGISLKQDFARFRKRLDSIFMTVPDDKYSLKSFIFYKFIQPRLLDQQEKPWYELENAVVIHGPPGTGKTSLATQLAECLGWNFLRLDTSTLLREGLDKAASSTSRVFEHLSYLTKTVILFDEIDECIRERSDPATTFENRLLTNTMLTNLNDLKTNKNIIFFVATNWFHNIDEAIKRPGRFDAVLYIDYPYPNELVRRMKEIMSIKKISLKPKVMEEIELSLRILSDKNSLLNKYKVIRDLADSKWEEFVNHVVNPIQGIDDVRKAVSFFQEEFKTYFYADQQPNLQYNEFSRINLYDIRDCIKYNSQGENLSNDILELEKIISSRS